MRVTRMYHPPRVSFAALPSTADVDDAIYRGCRYRNWQPERVSDGVMRAMLHLRAHTVTVEIDYGRDWFEVRYVSSNNLRYSNRNGVDMIHANYNGWIKFLVDDLQRSIEDERMALRHPAAPKAAAGN